MRHGSAENFNHDNVAGTGAGAGGKGAQAAAQSHTHSQQWQQPYCCREFVLQIAPKRLAIGRAAWHWGWGCHWGWDWGWGTQSKLLHTCCKHFACNWLLTLRRLLLLLMLLLLSLHDDNNNADDDDNDDGQLGDLGLWKFHGLAEG